MAQSPVSKERFMMQSKVLQNMYRNLTGEAICLIGVSGKEVSWFLPEEKYDPVGVELVVTAGLHDFDEGSIELQLVHVRLDKLPLPAAPVEGNFYLVPLNVAMAVMLSGRSAADLLVPIDPVIEDGVTRGYQHLRNFS